MVLMGWTRPGRVRQTGTNVIYRGYTPLTSHNHRTIPTICYILRRSASGVYHIELPEVADSQALICLSPY
jgi:hypothetical protein